MKFAWIRKDVVPAVHDRQIAEHGGAGGIRDMGLVESALARAQKLVEYGSPDIYDLAAADGYGLARNHGFVDGNKRTAYVVTRLFLRVNGHDLSAPPVQRVIVFERLGKGEISQDDVAAWLRKHGSPFEMADPASCGLQPPDLLIVFEQWHPCKALQMNTSGGKSIQVRSLEKHTTRNDR